MLIVSKDHPLPLSELQDRLSLILLQPLVQVLDLFGVCNMVELPSIASLCSKRLDQKMELLHILNRLRINQTEKFFTDSDIEFSKVMIHVPQW